MTHNNSLGSFWVYHLIFQYLCLVFVQSLTHVWLFTTPCRAACHASLSLTIYWSMPKFMSIASVMPYNSLILCHSLHLCIQSFPASGSFPMSWLFASCGQSTRASASASVLPVSIQGWFPLRLTGFISLLSKVFSRVFTAPQFKSISSLALSFLYAPVLTSIYDYWKKHSFD